jgi:uncharacterized membrane protein YdcZ (DUF606 family)
LQFDVDWKFIGKSTLASIFMTFFIFWLNLSGLSGTIISIILGALIYGLFIILFKGINKKEFDFFKVFLTEALKK